MLAMAPAKFGRDHTRLGIVGVRPCLTCPSQPPLFRSLERRTLASAAAITMEAAPPPGGGGGGAGDGKGDGDDNRLRRRGQQSMDVFGGTEGQAVLFIAVLMYVVQQLTTWANSNCTC